jgi:ATPase subunit of ABC transporter with duplicated ATPase domains
LEDGGEKYEGNYSYFVKEKEEKELRQFEQYKNEQKKIEELKKAVARLYEWGKKSDNPATFRRAKAIQKRIDEMEANGVSKPQTRKDLPIKFDNSSRGGNEVINIKNLSLILGDKLIFDNASADIRVFEKVALVGKNGTGKSTLLKCILNEINDYDGVIKVGGSVSIGYLPQLLTFDDNKQSVLEYVTSHTELREEGARRTLAKFDFYKDDVEKSVGKLSGGEKIRVKLACLLENKVNTLIFDEPTNHIDIFTRETLEDAMKEFKGTIIFVSHDRYFINSIATSILELNDGKLKMYNGNYDDYKNKDIKVETQVEVKPIKIKPPKISKGGKW